MKKKILRSIRTDCNVNLRPSKVCDGVGVFALVNIPKHKTLFSDLKPDELRIGWDEVNNLPDQITDYLSRICISDKDGFKLSRTVSEINISYFVNHSDDPNVMYDQTYDRYITIRDISEGEEILVKYIDHEIDW